MSVFIIKKPSVFRLAPVSIVEDKQLIRNYNLINGGVSSVSIVCNLNEAKDYIGENWKVYVKNRDRVIPKNKTYAGFKSKYHTFIKLQQAFDLACINTEFHTFYDLAFAPGAFTEGLLRLHPIDKCFGISLKCGKESLKVDETIAADKRFKIISPDDGNMYKKVNLDISIAEVGKVDLVCADGGFDVYSLGINENLQSLVIYHLIFCELVYAANFCKEGGTFVCKLFDTFDKYTANVIQAMAIYFDNVKITKPEESRLVNSERYIVCDGFHQNEELTSHLNMLLEVSENSNPGMIFEELDRDFLQSLKLATETIAAEQTKEIYRVVRKCKSFNRK